MRTKKKNLKERGSLVVGAEVKEKEKKKKKEEKGKRGSSRRRKRFGFFNWPYFVIKKFSSNLHGGPRGQLERQLHDQSLVATSDNNANFRN